MPTSQCALTSELLTARGVRHGFSTRLGGVSEGEFSSLNVAVSPGDDPSSVTENLRRYAAAIDVDPARLYQISQVHGSSVREVSAEDDRVALLRELGDALIARDPSIAIGVRVADCVPILMLDETSGHVAAVHAGWRGVVADVIAVALVTLIRNAPRGPRAIVAAIGPCIGPCCFEVDDDVARTIEGAAPGDAAVVRRDRPKPHVDLRRAVRLQLRALGVDDARIEDVEGCTRCDDRRFFSYRRDGARSGRHLASIAARSAS